MQTCFAMMLLCISWHHVAGDRDITNSVKDSSSNEQIFTKTKKDTSPPVDPLRASARARDKEPVDPLGASGADESLSFNGEAVNEDEDGFGAPAVDTASAGTVGEDVPAAQNSVDSYPDLANSVGPNSTNFTPPEISQPAPQTSRSGFSSSPGYTSVGGSSGNVRTANQRQGSSQGPTQRQGSSQGPTFSTLSQKAGGSGRNSVAFKTSTKYDGQFYSGVQNVTDKVAKAVSMASKDAGMLGRESDKILKAASFYHDVVDSLKADVQSFRLGVRNFRQQTAAKHSNTVLDLEDKFQSGLESGLKKFDIET